MQLEGLERFKEIDNIKVFEFDSLGNAEKFRKNLQTEYLENINDQDISNVEIKVGEVDLFEIDNNGKVISKKILG